MMAESQEIEYKEHYVAYLDILGYKALMVEAVKDNREREAIRELQSAIHHQSENFEFLKQRGYYAEMNLRVFSDTIVIAASADQYSCFSIILFTMSVVTGLVYRNIFVRGAITRGKHFDDGEVLFSPAYVKASEMERDEACYPRVLVDSSLTRPHRGHIFDF